MDAIERRVQLLDIAARFQRDGNPVNLIAAAKQLEEYVMEPEAKADQSAPSDAGTDQGNANPTSQEVPAVKVAKPSAQK